VEELLDGIQRPKTGFTNFRSGLYNLVLGQCSDALQDKLKSHRDYTPSNQNGIALLLIIKALTHTSEDQLYLPNATASASGTSTVCGKESTNPYMHTMIDT
jgi:hypothetical protein